MIRYTELKNTARHDLREVIPLAKPFTFVIEPSGACNFRCKMCFQSAAEEEYKDKRRVMDMELFREIIAQAKNWQGDRFKVLKLCLYGEPFTNPNFGEMLKEANAANIADRIETTTNASLLTEEVARSLIEGGLNYLRVSIYSAKPERHLDITSSNVPSEQIHANLARLQALKKELGKTEPFVAVKMLDTYNEDENELFRQTYKDVADEIYLDEPHSWVEINDERFITRLYGEDIKKVRRDLKNRKACPMPFTTLAVRADGSVSPCCNDWYGGTNIGRIQDETLPEIWRGQSMFDFLMMQLEGRNRENVSCKGCTVYKSKHYLRDDIDEVSADVFQKRWDECEWNS